jgi:hypothetical protein
MKHPINLCIISAYMRSSDKCMEFPFPSALIVVILIVLSFLEIEWGLGIDPFCLAGCEAWCPRTTENSRYTLRSRALAMRIPETYIIYSFI